MSWAGALGGSSGPVLVVCCVGTDSPHRAPRPRLLGLLLVWPKPDVLLLPTVPAAGCGRVTKFWPVTCWQNFWELP